jgi:hypothetical protein
VVDPHTHPPGVDRLVIDPIGDHLALILFQRPNNELECREVATFQLG